jgi:CRP-like cAMP-binding protein
LRAMEQVFQFLAQYVELTDKEKELVISTNRKRYFKKNETIKNVSKDSNETFFVLSGCVYSLYGSNSAEQVVGDFFFAGEPVLIPTASAATESQYELRCIETTTLAVSTEDEVERLIRESPRFERVCRLFAEKKLAQNTIFYDQLKRLAPLEKYRFLFKERPQLIQRVPQYLLASYLGIAPETLSRVRRQISTNDLDLNQ